MPVGRDSIEPTENFIRRSFTAISTVRVAATAVEISSHDLLCWVTIRRSNQLNYAPALKLQLLICYRFFPPVPIHSQKFPKVP